MKTYLLGKGRLGLQEAGDLEVLKAWHESKEVLKKDLKTYFKLKFNPDLEFQDTLLQSIGFRPCKSCA
jgi:ribosome-binding factor A